jgi:uncharacterized membrane protein
MHPEQMRLGRATLAPLAALALASALSVGFVIARVLTSGNIHYSFLIWNLFLAWLPLAFAILARQAYRTVASGVKVRGAFLGWSLAWLLFFPNAPYICTDLVHLTHRFFGPFWVDLAIVLSCAFTGLMLGFVSLYLMQSLVRQRYGARVGWMFVAAMAGLGSFGIYLGRFLRFNSWDVVTRPGQLYQELTATATGAGHPHHLAFFVMFALFFLVAYVLIYALTHLPHAVAPVVAAPSPSKPA